ncbi:MAG: guanylate kinase, partial [Pseudomonadota bacterium]|nr:guanylate kinase [Pseudomonadota bacterium]
GKTSLVKALLPQIDGLSVSVSHTTRAMRTGEQDGLHYHFVSVEQFIAQINAGGFIEHAEVFGNYYGTSQAAVMNQLHAGQDVLLEIDCQGAAQVRRLFPDSIQIFIVPPTRAALRERLSNRGQDSDAVIERRLAGSLAEIEQHVSFDYLVVNDTFETALDHLKSIIQAARLTLPQQAIRQQALLTRLISGE